MRVRRNLRRPGPRSPSRRRSTSTWPGGSIIVTPAYSGELPNSRGYLQSDREAALLQATVYENRWIPDQIKSGLTPRQAEFLAFEGREALYGGAAGGGKSVAMLCAALQFADVPGYSALILRRTYAQLAKSDSILNKAKEWLMPHVSAGRIRWNGDERKFTFPMGSTLEFGHMDHEDSIYNYQGGIWPFIGVDEATQFTQTMLAYPRTRQRRQSGSLLPMRWRGASNPGGVGHEYVKTRYVRGKDGKAVDDPERRFFPRLSTTIRTSTARTTFGNSATPGLTR